jgi:transposase
VTRRNQIVRQRVRRKTITQSILQAHLLPQGPHADLFGNRGRNWLLAQHLPPDERDAVERHLREYDRLGEDRKVVERELARDVLADASVKRLMTIPGIDMVVALGLTAAIGPINRFKGPDQLVAYIGLNPSVYQSGEAYRYPHLRCAPMEMPKAMSWRRVMPRQTTMLPGGGSCLRAR